MKIIRTKIYSSNDDYGLGEFLTTLGAGAIVLGGTALIAKLRQRKLRAQNEKKLVSSSKMAPIEQYKIRDIKELHNLVKLRSIYKYASSSGVDSSFSIYLKQKNPQLYKKYVENYLDYCILTINFPDTNVGVKEPEEWLNVINISKNIAGLDFDTHWWNDNFPENIYKEYNENTDSINYISDITDIKKHIIQFIQSSNKFYNTLKCDRCYEDCKRASGRTIDKKEFKETFDQCVKYVKLYNSELITMINKS